VANLLKNLRLAASFAGSKAHKARRGKSAPKGRLDLGPPIAVIDIGSNSVRLVIYEGLTRNLTPIFNEKVMAGLGREVQSTGLIAPEAVDIALAALRRYRALCDALHVGRVLAIATAACRDAGNGPEFIARCQKICRVKIEVLSGKREAHLTALGVISGIHRPDGIVGDLGGGSLEIVDVRGSRVKAGATVPLGGLALQDTAGRSLRKAQKIVGDHLDGLALLKGGRRRTLYAVGGTWRALARLHMWQTGYPLHVMHNYVIPAKEALAFCRRLYRRPLGRMPRLDVVNKARRALLPYAALVMERLLRETKAKQVVISVLGVREGLLYSLLPERERNRDALIEAAQELNLLRSRSPRHGEELIAWTDRLMKGAGIDETEEERRLRHAACLLADIGWRAHPDYRGEQSLNIIANAGFAEIDHPGRAFLALAVYFRHAGLDEAELSPRLLKLVSPRLLERARILAAALRVAYLVSASQTGVLGKTPILVSKKRLILRLDGRRLSALGGERVFSRLRQLAREVGLKPSIATNYKPALKI
jgi:exopolyphosphatase/guanosine-5'-triphosphate,3'-diphosphate pyrophosphatase